MNLRTTPAIIADMLREQVLAGSFRPGERLAEVQIAAKLGVSRGPVREALQRLVQEGLLVNLANRGVRVVKLTNEDVLDIYRARRAIEREAISIAFHNKSEALLARLTSIVQSIGVSIKSNDLSQVVERDLAFHTAIVEAADSPRLKRMFSTLLAETRLSMTHLINFDFTELVSTHGALIELLRSGTKAQLMKAVDKHLDSSIREMLENHPTRE